MAANITLQNTVISDAQSKQDDSMNKYSIMRNQKNNREAILNHSEIIID